MTIPQQPTVQGPAPLGLTPLSTMDLTPATGGSMTPIPVLQAPRPTPSVGGTTLSVGGALTDAMINGLAGSAINSQLSGTPGAGLGSSIIDLSQGNTQGAANAAAPVAMNAVGNAMATNALNSGTTSAAGEAFSNAAPFVGTALNFARNGVNRSTVLGAGLGYAGTLLGNAILPGVGGILGGALGGMLSSCCFITQAVMDAVGGHDRSYELQVMRAWRDGYMLKDPQLVPLVKEYYAIAPLVVNAINRRPDAKQIYVQLYHQFILPTVKAIVAGNMELALETYTAMLKAVAPLAQQAEPNPHKQQAIQQLGNHSGQVQGALSQLRGAP